MEYRSPYVVFTGFSRLRADIPPGFTPVPQVGVLYRSVEGYTSDSGQTLWINVINEHVKSFIESIKNDYNYSWFYFGVIDGVGYFTTGGKISLDTGGNDTVHVKNARRVMAWAGTISGFSGQTEMPSDAAPVANNSDDIVVEDLEEAAEAEAVDNDNANFVVEDLEEAEADEETPTQNRLAGWYRGAVGLEHLTQAFDDAPVMGTTYRSGVDMSDRIYGNDTGTNAAMRFITADSIRQFGRILNDEGESFFWFKEPGEDEEEGGFTTYGTISSEPSLSTARRVLVLSTTLRGYIGQSLASTTSTATTVSTAAAENRNNNNDNDTRAPRLDQLRGFYNEREGLTYVSAHLDDVPAVGITYTSRVNMQRGVYGDDVTEDDNASITFSTTDDIRHVYDTIRNDGDEPFFRFHDPDEDEEYGQFTTYGVISSEPALSAARRVLRLSAGLRGYNGQRGDNNESGDTIIPEQQRDPTGDDEEVDNASTPPQVVHRANNNTAGIDIEAVTSYINKGVVSKGFFPANSALPAGYYADATPNTMYKSGSDFNPKNTPFLRIMVPTDEDSRHLKTILNENGQPWFRFMFSFSVGTFTTVGKLRTGDEMNLQKARLVLAWAATSRGYRGQHMRPTHEDINTVVPEVAEEEHKEEREYTNDGIRRSGVRAIKPVLVFDDTLRDRYIQYSKKITSASKHLKDLKEDMVKVQIYGNKLMQMLEEQYVIPPQIPSTHKALKGKYADLAQKAIEKAIARGVSIPTTKDQQLLFMLERHDHDKPGGGDAGYHGSGPLYDRLHFKHLFRGFYTLGEMTRQSLLNTGDAASLLAAEINEEDPKYKHTKAYTDVLVNEVGEQLVRLYPLIKKLKKSVQGIKTLVNSRLLTNVSAGQIWHMNGFDYIGGWTGEASSHQYDPRYSLGADFRIKEMKPFLMSLFTHLEKIAIDVSTALDDIQPDHPTSIIFNEEDFKDSDHPSPQSLVLEGGVPNNYRVDDLPIVYSDPYPQPTSAPTPYNALDRTYTPQAGIAYYSTDKGTIPDNVTPATRLILITRSNEIEEDAQSPYYRIQDILNDDNQPFFRFSRYDDLGRKERPFYTAGTITKSSNEENYNRSQRVLTQAGKDITEYDKVGWISMHSRIGARLTDDPVLHDYKETPGAGVFDDAVLTAIPDRGYQHPIRVDYAQRVRSAWESRPDYTGPLVFSSYTDVSTGNILYIDNESVKRDIDSLKTSKNRRVFTFDNVNKTYTVAKLTERGDGVIVKPADRIYFTNLIELARNHGERRRRETPEISERIREVIEQGRRSEERERRLQATANTRDQQTIAESRHRRGRSRSPSRDGSAAAVVRSGDRSSRAPSPTPSEDEEEDDLSGMARLSLHRAPQKPRKPQSTKVIARYRAVVPVVTRTSRNSLLK